MLAAEVFGEPALECGLRRGGGAILRGLNDARLNGLMRGLVARVGRMEDAKRFEPVAMVHGEAPGDHPAKREAENRRLADAEMIEKLAELFREHGERGLLRREAALAVAVKIEGDDAMVPRQCRDLPLP